MISKRYPSITLSITMVLCNTAIVGSSIFEFSMIYCNKIGLILQTVGIICLVCSCYFALNLIELKVWIITYNNNFALATQDMTWKSCINSKIKPINHNNQIKNKNQNKN